MRKQAFSEVVLIANPTSGCGRAAGWAEEVAGVLRSAGRRVDVVLTGGPGEAEAAARRCGGADVLLLVLGGDGTFHEVLNGADLELSLIHI